MVSKTFERPQGIAWLSIDENHLVAPLSLEPLETKAESVHRACVPDLCHMFSQQPFELVRIARNKIGNGL